MALPSSPPAAPPLAPAPDEGAPVAGFGPDEGSRASGFAPDEGAPPPGPARQGPAPAAPPPSPPGSALGEAASVGLLRTTLLLVLVAAVVARGVAPALPGVGTGLGVWIDLTQRVAAWLTWLALAALAITGTRAMVQVLQLHELGGAFRLAVVPLAAGILTLVMASTQGELEVPHALALGAAAACLALGASPLACLRSETRAAGLVLALSGLAALVAVIGRAWALRAAGAGQLTSFEQARWLGTASFALDALALVLAVTWLVRRSLLVGWLAWLGVLGGSAALVFLGERATRELDAPGWQVLTGRALDAVLRHPAPHVVPAARQLVELVALGLVAMAALGGSRSTMGLRAILGFAILARASTDIPLLALCLLVATLLALLAAAEAPTAAPAPPPGGDAPGVSTAPLATP